MTTALTEHHRRRTKTDRLRAQGIDPFPCYDGRNRNLIANVVASGEVSQGAVDHASNTYELAGRIVRRRQRGPVTFLELRDRSGIIRLRVDADVPPFDRSSGGCAWDIGDIVSVVGLARPLHTGEVGLEVSSGRLLAKALQVHHGLSQAGHRTRRPELALMESENYRNRFAARACVVAAIRDWMTRHGFIEVETPMLQPRLGGALARPFYTHHNALDREASLRISSELYLRRCTVGDLERVFELGRCFRNEGMSTRHSPEFAMLEWSMSYSNYHDSATLIERLVKHLALEAIGKLEVVFQGTTIHLETPWRRISLRDAIEEHTGLDITVAEDLASLSPENGADESSWSEAVHRLYATEVEPHLHQPSIVFDFPLDTHPCAEGHPVDGRFAQCFDVVLGGLEIASGGTEINDPDEQQRRFVQQREAGGDCPSPCSGERDYVTALGYGAPPSSGAGVGVDRLLMVLLGAENINEVSLFSSLE